MVIGNQLVLSAFASGSQVDVVDNIPDVDVGLDEAWPHFQLSHGIEQFQSRENIRIHRPNSLAIQRIMTTTFNSPRHPVPFDLIEQVFRVWPEFETGSMRWPTWKLVPMHPSYYVAGLWDIADKEYVLISETDQTVPNFCRPHSKAILLHLDIGLTESVQRILKCLKVPPRCTATQLLDTDRTNTMFFTFTAHEVWHNGVPWPLQDSHDIEHGDFVYANLWVSSWSTANPLG